MKNDLGGIWGDLQTISNLSKGKSNKKPKFDHLMIYQVHDGTEREPVVHPEGGSGDQPLFLRIHRAPPVKKLPGMRSGDSVTVQHSVCVILAGAGSTVLLNLINFTVEIKATRTHKLGLCCFLSEQYPFIFQ